MKRLEACCCCISTRAGSIIAAVLGIVLAIATIVLVWVAPTSVVSFSSFLFEEWDKKYDVSRIIITISLCFTILICGLLIVATQMKTYSRRSWLMLPWVVLGLVLAIGMLISVLHTAIVFYRHEEDHVILATCILIGGLVYLAIFMYLWVVVLSHYLDVRDDEERGRYSKAPYRR